MDWHGTFETAFLVMFLVGLLLTLVSAVFSGVFESEIGSGSALGGGVATDMGTGDIHTGELAPGDATVGWGDVDMLGLSPLNPSVICAFLAGTGGIGYLALKSWGLNVPSALGLGLVGGLVVGGGVFFGLAALLQKVQGSSHVHEDSLLGQKGVVSTVIEPGRVGAVNVEAGGSRMSLPARCADASRVPERAEVVFKAREGAVYVVEETHESWLARSRQSAGEQRWS
jgi:hypothetical protein